MRILGAALLTAVLPTAALAGGDFNGDGFDDVAIAAPSDPVLGAPSGSVSVMYGSMYGLEFVLYPAPQHLTPFHFGLAPNLDDEFGAALAIGDFDGDGFADLAIGMPKREVSGVPDAGAVGVLYGAAFGLNGERSQLFTQATKGIQDDPDPPTALSSLGDEFGCTLAAGDWNGDGRDDLAIGARSEDVGEGGGEGAVHVLRGSKKGLRAKKNLFVTREGLHGTGTASGFYGDALASGDFDGDGFADLAIGGWGTDFEEVSTGVVDVLRGSKKGLVTSGVLELAPLALVGGEPDSLYFGYDLAAGDFDGDGADDLAIGAPGTPVSDQKSAGATHVVYGTVGGGLDTASIETWDEVALATGYFEAYDQLGSALAAADFDSDGRDDLAIGVPFAEVAGLANAGEVLVLRGVPAGLTGPQIWSQATPNVGGAGEAGDQFGRALATGDYDGDGAQDLLVGSPGETVGAVESAGAAIVLYGEEGGTGLTDEGDEVLARGDAVDAVPMPSADFGFAFGR